MFNYDEYLKWVQNQNAAPRMNDGQAYSPMSRAVYDEAQQGGNLWNLLGGLIDLQPGDPGYEQMSQSILAQQPGSDVRSIAYSSGRGGADPNKTVAVPDGYAWSVDNSVHPKESDDWRLAAMGIGTVLGGAFLGNSLGFGAEGLGGMEGGAFDMGGSSGFGGSTPLGAESIASTPPNSYWNQIASNGSTDGLFGEGLTGGDLPYGTEMPNTYAPGADPTSAFGLGESYYTPGMGAGMNEQTWLQRLLGPLANPSQLPQWAMDNPASAFRAIAGIGSIAQGLGAGGGSNGGGGAGELPWNGPVPQFNPQQGQFQQNPHLNFNVPFMGRR